ncbi:hypothetical protein B0T22DRAFT_171416 [Podospora appendiculata]|uniref:Uncharacterized protein n=1 Tax=Podospora appendiculata TaxID=314037 RepID=A0AAE1CDA5_9PEZI|nr:hypothetical protein B0T22DRAFT_171416 [Podospora appendiculata]
MAPTKTLPAVADLVVRQTTATVTVAATTDTTTTNSSGGSSVGGGEIAGIVIGTIVGILLIWWIVKRLSSPDKARAEPARSDRQGWYDDDRSRSRHSRSRSGHRHQHHHHSRRRSSASRPVVIEEKTAYAPRRPSATYVQHSDGRVTRSRSRSAGRYDMTY